MRELRCSSIGIAKFACREVWNLYREVIPLTHSDTPTDYRHTDKQITQMTLVAQTNRQMDGRTLPSALSPYYLVDNDIVT